MSAADAYRRAAEMVRAEVERLREALRKIEGAAFNCMPHQWAMAMRDTAHTALAQPADPHAVAREVAKRRAGVCAELAQKEGGE